MLIFYVSWDAGGSTDLADLLFKVVDRLLIFIDLFDDIYSLLGHWLGYEGEDLLYLVEVL